MTLSKTKHPIVAVAMAALTASAGSGQAAVLEIVSGNVLVATAAGFETAAPAQPLDKGARVMAKAGGSAVIRYSAGCSEDVRPGKVVIIKSDEACTQSQTESSAKSNKGVTAAAATDATTVVARTNIGSSFGTPPSYVGAPNGNASWQATVTKSGVAPATPSSPTGWETSVTPTGTPTGAETSGGASGGSAGGGGAAAATPPPAAIGLGGVSGVGVAAVAGVALAAGVAAAAAKSTAHSP